MEIFRSISEDEKLDIEKNKKFNTKAGQYEGKLFAESDQDASKFGKTFFLIDRKPFYIVKVELEDDEFERKLGIELLDQYLGVGATIAVDRDQLEEFNRLMRFNILSYVVV